MTKRILIFLFILSISLYPQKVNVEVDAFSDERIVSTSWEKLHVSLTGLYIYYQFTQNTDGIPFVKFAVAFNDAFFYSQDEELLLKFNNDSISKLKSISYSLATTGGATSASMWLTDVPGSIVNYTLIENTDILLDNNLLTDLRMHYNTSQGRVYLDVKIKSTESKKLQKAYKMFIEEINKNATE